MSPTRKRLLRVAAVVVAQLLCLWVAVGLLMLRTTWDLPNAYAGSWLTSGPLTVTFPTERDGHAIRWTGYPVPWQEEKLRFKVTSDTESGAERTHSESSELVGRNPAVPPVVVSFALSLPLVVAARGRLRRVCAVILLAAVGALSIAWVEWDSDNVDFSSPVRVHPPGSWIIKTKTGRSISDAADDRGRSGRLWLRIWLPEANPLILPNWPARTRLTLLAFATGAGVGCVLLRPWRHPGGAAAGTSEGAVEPARA